jgi:hypothetical protein
MTKSQRPRLKELLDIHILVGECCEVGRDPVTWNLGFLDGLQGILGYHVGIAGERRTRKMTAERMIS